MDTECEEGGDYEDLGNEGRDNSECNNDDIECNNDNISVYQGHETFDVSNFYVQNKNKLKFALLNINSLRHKLYPIMDILQHNFIDVMMLQETKLDDTFPDAQFAIQGFMLHRVDFKCNSGGLITYARGDLPQKRFDMGNVFKVNEGRIEGLAVELNLNGDKWIIVNVYKQPQTPNGIFLNCIDNVLSLCTQAAPNIIICGDLNINVLNTNNCIKDVLDIHGMVNIVKEPTCYKAIEPTLLDLVITNVSKRIVNIQCITNCLSDFHKMICFATRANAPCYIKRVIRYRSYKHFDNKTFQTDLLSAPFQVAEMFDSVNDSLMYTQQLLVNVINNHAPMKSRVITYKEAPYMNDVLRKAINVKNHFKRKWEKISSRENHKIYVKHKNYTNKLRKMSMKNYLQKNCIDRSHCNSKQYWSIIKPFMSNKGSSRNTDIALLEKGIIVNQHCEVANILNTHYVNITKHIGEPDLICDDSDINDILLCHNTHASVLYVKQYMNVHHADLAHFKFRHVMRDEVLQILNSINIRKSAGIDTIPPKLLKAGASHLCNTIMYLVNKCIDDCVFPDELKLAEVVPIFKKDDLLDKKNYRPISILSCVSKVFERIFIEQMNCYFKTLFSPYLSGYRKHHGCQDVLVYFVSLCKKVLDKGEVAIALLTDLSKAFDSLPYKLLICKLSAYGLGNNACMLIKSYFCNRKQTVRIGIERSDWRSLIKGVPQGSLMGPFIFNVFYNDLLLLLDEYCHVFNYADDTSILCTGHDYNDAYVKICSASTIMLEWFKSNFMQANPSKFQYIVFEKDKQPRNIVLNEGTVIESVSKVKLLGVVIDSALIFNEHISVISQKAGRQLNALARLSNVFNTETKLLIMQSFILSQFTYCCVVYHFCSRADMVKIEKLQRKALRFVYQDYQTSYTLLRERSNRPLLYVERQRCLLQEVYKSIHSLGPIYLNDMFKIKKCEYDYRNMLTIVLPKYKTVTHGKDSLQYNAVKLFNCLNNEYKIVPTLLEFKSKIKNWNGEDCSCRDCAYCTLLNL